LHWVYWSASFILWASERPISKREKDVNL
jgi:hypothetical protein